jgi:hypothetical protein
VFKEFQEGSRKKIVKYKKFYDRYVKKWRIEKANQFQDTINKQQELEAKFMILPIDAQKEILDLITALEEKWETSMTYKNFAIKYVSNFYEKDFNKKETWKLYYWLSKEIGSIELLDKIADNENKRLKED